MTLSVGAPEIHAVEAVEHRLQRLRRVEMLQLVHCDDLLQLCPDDLLNVAGIAARALLRPSTCDALTTT